MGELLDGDEMCHCGKRRGLHRYGDECCPNPAWKCGNGEPQWWAHRRFVAFRQRAESVAEWPWKPHAEPITG